MNKIFSIIFLVSSTLLMAQERETRSLPSFSEISVSHAIDVELVKGTKSQAEIEVDGADLDEIITEVVGDKLRVKMKDRRGGYRNVDVRVVVSFQNLEKIEVSSASNLYSRDVISGDMLKIVVSSAADADLKVDVRELDVSVQSAGDLEISGKVRKQYVNVSSAGDYDAYGLESEEADIDVSSSGDARITVSKVLNADASSSGTVYYRGDPQKVYSDSSSSGKVKRS